MWSGASLLALLMIVQFVYPSSHLPLFARVDGVALGGWTKADAIKRLDALSREQKLKLPMVLAYYSIVFILVRSVSIREAC